ARLCGSGKPKQYLFFIETSVRVQLLDAGGGTIYDGLFVYSRSKDQNERKYPYGRFQPYVVLLPQESPARKLEDYCRAAGGEIVVQEISKAVGLSVQSTLQQVGTRRNHYLRKTTGADLGDNPEKRIRKYGK